MEKGPMRARVTCPNCDAVEVFAAHIRIHEEDMTYDFICPQCGTNVFKKMTKSVLLSLRDAGAQEGVVIEPEYEGDAPVLTQDDLITLHFELDDEEAIKAWLA